MSIILKPFEDGQEDEGEPTPSPEDGHVSARDVEEALAEQRVRKGDPEPYRGLQGRDDTTQGGRYEGLEKFAAFARKNGTTLQNAVRDYSQGHRARRR